MNEITIELATEELRQVLTMVAVGVPKSRRARADAVVECDIRPDRVRFATLGASGQCPCKADACAKAFLPFAYLLYITKRVPDPRMSIGIVPGTVRIGGSEFSSPNIQITHPENQPTIDLPLNYTILDVLKLEEKYDSETLERMKLSAKIEQAQDQVDDDVLAAQWILCKYEIFAQDIRQLIDQRIRRHR